MQITGEGGVDIEFEEIVGFALHLGTVVAGEGAEVGVEETGFG